MNSTKLKQAYFLLALTIGFITLPASSTKAATIFWDMSLFDDTGTQVGDGEFSYDPETFETLNFSSLGGSGEVTVNGVLESISISIYGEELISDSYTLFKPWWNTNSDNAMQNLELGFRIGTFIANNWESPDFNIAPPVTGDLIGAFQLNGSSTSDTGQGAWSLNGGETLGSPFSSPDPSPLPDRITSILQGRTFNGSWTANIREGNPVDSDSDSATTPESSSIFALFGLGIFSLSVAMRKHYRNNRC